MTKGQHKCLLMYFLASGANWRLFNIHKRIYMYLAECSWLSIDSLAHCAWWRHQMTICVGNSPVTVTMSYDVFFDLPVNKWLSKQ